MYVYIYIYICIDIYIYAPLRILFRSCRQTGTPRPRRCSRRAGRRRRRRCACPCRSKRRWAQGRTSRSSPEGSPSSPVSGLGLGIKVPCSY